MPGLSAKAPVWTQFLKPNNLRHFDRNASLQSLKYIEIFKHVQTLLSFGTLLVSFSRPCNCCCYGRRHLRHICCFIFDGHLCHLCFDMFKTPHLAQSKTRHHCSRGTLTRSGLTDSLFETLAKELSKAGPGRIAFQDYRLKVHANVIRKVKCDMAMTCQCWPRVFSNNSSSSLHLQLTETAN